MTSQSFCGARRMRAPFAPPRLSEPRNVDADAHAVETSWDTVRPDARIFALRSAMSALPDQRMIHRRDRVLPDQRLLRHERAEVARDRAHVAVRELEPGAGKRVRELVRMLVEAPRDLLVGRVEPQRRGPSSAWSAHASSTGRRHPEWWLRAPFAFHWLAPAGLFVSSHSYPNRFSKKWLLHFVGVCVQVTSGPPVMASAPKPVPCLLFQPRP